MSEVSGSGCTSCSTCPAKLGPTETSMMFGRDGGSPVCGHSGTVLGRPGMAPREQIVLFKNLAAACGKAGKTAPSLIPADVTSQVVLPKTPRPQATPENMRASRCSSCIHQVPALEVADKFGWTLPICSVTGKMLFPAMDTSEASGCQTSFSGAPQASAADLQLAPVFQIAAMTASAALADGHGTPQVTRDIDPREYPTDKPVSEQDAALGVRAWRMVEDPAGYGKPLPMPIFRDDAVVDDFFRASIPVTGSQGNPEAYVDHAGLLYRSLVALRANISPVFTGDAGTGKTEFVRFFSWLGNMPFTRINITGASMYDEIFGTMMFVKVDGIGQTVFKKGRVPRAWENIGALCVDEANGGSDEIWQAFRSMTDNSAQLVLEGAAIVDPATGDLITPPPISKNKHAYLFLPMNPAWDTKYTGIRELSMADQSRLGVMHVPFPPAEVERELLTRVFCRMSTDGKPPQPKILDYVMKIATELRELASVDGGLPISWGIREQQKVLLFSEFMPLAAAYKMALTDFLEPRTARMVLDVVEANVPSSASSR